MSDIGAYIRDIRKSRHLMLRQVAERSGLSVSYLSDIERGRTQPSLETLESIACAFGLELKITFAENGEDMRYRLLRDSVGELHTRLGEILKR